MVQMSQPLILLSMCWGFLNCTGSVDQHENASSNTTFFDLKAYFKSEAARLNALQPMGTKIIDFESESDSIRLDTAGAVDFNEELKAFISSDINRVAWASKYVVDSLRRNGDLVELVYKATEDELKTRKITIYFEKEAIREIHIHNTLKSLIASSNQVLVYNPARGYEVKGQQHIRFGKSYAFKAAVVFDYKR